MKPFLVILGAGPSRGEGQPLGVQMVTLRGRVLDWQLDAFAALEPETSFVGGYDVEVVMRQFPHLAYHYNPDWARTGAAASLEVALQSLDELQDGRRDLYVAYSDILLRPQLVGALAGLPGDACTVVLDHPHRDDGRPPELLDLGEGAREFVGLIRVPAALVPVFRQAVLRDAPALRGRRLSPLFEQWRKRGTLPLRPFAAAGQWAHAEHNRSVARFILGSKAGTLERLQGRLRASRILPLTAFRRGEWAARRDDLVAGLLRRFAAEPALIVRSSASDEDGFHQANAGKYHSELNVPLQAGAIGEAVDQVLASYGDGDPADEVLVQPQLADVRASGVVFTRVLESGAPYRVIHYTLGADTTLVTGGASRDGVRLYVARHAPVQALRELPEMGQRVLAMAEEIEESVRHDALDIEFALAADGGLVTLQVRPLMVGDAHQDRTEDAAVADALSGVHALLGSLAAPPPGQVGGTTAWSVMADWNPAEIVGLTPAPLALDLYRHVVTDATWARQRQEAGYRDLRGWPLVRSFAGQAFVDVRASLNSFVPADVPEALATVIVDHALDRLRARPELHDKIEFELVPTCLDFGFRRWEADYCSAGMATRDVHRLRECLGAVTRGIVGRAGQELARVTALERRCTALEQPAAPLADWLRRTLAVCRDEGALAFAHLARAGFVAAALLGSAVRAGLLAAPRRQELMESIPGLGHLLTETAWAVREGRLARTDFIARFGHLRPGTYDIAAASYRQRPQDYLDPIIARAAAQPPVAAFRWTPEEADALDAALADLELGMDAGSLLDFVHTAVWGREYAKFVFTRLLSAVLDVLAEEGTRAGVPPEQLGCMPLDAWLGQSVLAWGEAGWRADLLELTERRRRRHRVAASILLPPLLASPEQVHAFAVPATEPNFVTARRVEAPLRVLRAGEVPAAADAAGCVVAVPNADPGFDYLFALGIRGLVTAFGGPNSHMAIRASEFAIPAVIGIGEHAFQRLRDGASIEIDGQQRFWRQGGAW